ncbi:hypothetical protein [Deinococcus petrolearius]|uniref:Uncharacterized protein n=1 Tax=Deinococcus petrolearius TaxID=1751295 RepID=A0ABW1DKP8_9DEIO
MRPTWILLIVLPLLALGLWSAQVAAQHRQSSPEVYHISPTRVQQVTQACAQHLGQAGALVESEMGPGFTALTDGDVTQWDVIAGWRSPTGQVRSLSCKAREDHGQLTVLSTELA